MKSLIGLDPISDNYSRILILGSFPSQQSLKLQQYYAHPRNHFWKLMHIICDIDSRLPYVERTRLLLTQYVALWDVIRSCNRVGSADQNITKPVPNDLKQFLLEHQSITHVYFNGHNPRKYVNRLIPRFLTEMNYRFMTLPSSSPANTKYTINEKIETWKIITR